MPRRKKVIDWTGAPTLDAPEKMFDGAVGSGCVGGSSAPRHSSASCPVYSWSGPGRFWWVCACDCHSLDRQDAELVADIKGELIGGDRVHRLAFGF